MKNKKAKADRKEIVEKEVDGSDQGSIRRPSWTTPLWATLTPMSSPSQVDLKGLRMPF